VSDQDDSALSPCVSMLAEMLLQYFAASCSLCSVEFETEVGSAGISN
jgi:hypothetical protein